MAMHHFKYKTANMDLFFIFHVFENPGYSEFLYSLANLNKCGSPFNNKEDIF